MEMDPKTKKMIFVVGASRSGTTMMGKILGRHSSVYTFDELQVFEKEITIEDMLSGDIERDRLLGIGERILASIEDGVFSNTRLECHREQVCRLVEEHCITDATTLYAAILLEKTRAAGKYIPCEQTPRYLFVIDELLAAFPEARVVNIYRDPRAVLLSQKNRWRRASLSAERPTISKRWTLTSWSNYHPILTSFLWVSAIRKGKKYLEHPRVFEICYEALLRDPEEKIRDLCDFIGIDFERNMQDIPIEGSSVRRDESTRAGLDSSRIDSWCQGGLTSAEIKICEQITKREMHELGYSSTVTHASLLSQLFLYGTLLPKSIAALLLNFSRFNNVVSYIKARLL